MSSLRAKQTASIKHMINLNTGGVNAESSVGNETVFSILVYDRQGQDVISPLLSVKELREMGVTLHLLIHTERGEIPDVPAIYFCLPTEENLVRIGQDFCAGLYSSYYLNFSSAIVRQKMEDLAQTAVQSGCQNSIKKVYDQYLNFVCLEENMFCLKHTGSESMSYYALNQGDVKDIEIEAIIDTCVDSLFAVFVNLGQVPIIRSERGNAAEMIAERLDKKLRENLRDTRSSFFTGLGSDSFTTGNLSFHRPLLMLVDRNVDLATPLHHTWTYQALTHDLLGLSLNRLNIPETDSMPGSARKTKSYDLNDDDLFWAEHKASPFPSVAASVETELENYKLAESRIKGLNLHDDANMFFDNTAKLTSAITSLPELIKKKANIDKHMSIAMALLTEIKQRKIDTYFETEEKIMAQTALEKPIMEIISDPEGGSPQDKMRFFLMYFLCTADIPDAEFEQYSSVLAEAGADIKALAYMKRWKSLLKMSTSAAPSEYTGGVAKTVSMFSKLVNHGSALVVEGVKNIVLKANKLPVTRILDNLMEQKNSSEDKEYLYFDPKIIRPQDPALTNARSKTPFQEAVVFVVGGGNYMEYTNLKSYAKRKSGAVDKKIIYGCTDVVSPEQFLNQLSKLGAAII